MKKGKIIKRFIPLLCATLLLLGSCLTVCASSYVLPSSLFNNWVIVDLGESYLERYSVRYMLITSDNAIVYDADTEQVTVVNSDSLVTKFYSSATLDFSSVSSSALYKSVATNDDYSPTILHANNNVCYGTSHGATDEVFFWLPIALLSTPLTEVVQNQTATILPIAVGCLALLIGSTILVKKLRIFL